MKRMTYFVMALAMVLGFTQCKKEQTTTSENEAKTVRITLNVGGNGGSRHTIDTENGDVGFEENDVIYVGDGSTYIGTLTRESGVFSGDVNTPAAGDKLYFYFVGGMEPSVTPDDGSVSGTPTTSFTVNISDQSSKMPVLSFNSVDYAGPGEYSCTLENKCALVKFTTASTTDPVRVGGLYTEAQIDFAAHSITHTATTGFVKLYPDADDNTAKWAVLLPQDDFSNIEGVVADKGYTISMQPETTISADGFITGEQAIGITSTPSHNRYLQWAVRDLTLEGGDHVYGTLSGNYKISIADDATVMLDGVSISYTGKGADYPGLNCKGDATIMLADGTSNTIVGGLDGDGYSNWPGIFVPQGSTLTINGNDGVLNARRGGNDTEYGSPAGIGASWKNPCGNIVINGGVINAEGGAKSAGIGGTFIRTCGDITINGGTITATGHKWGVGIGLGGTENASATSLSGCNITITGGTVDATGGWGGAGIGTGFADHKSGGTMTITLGDILISGGNVTATGGVGAAGIGTGGTEGSNSNNCSNITITDGVTIVTASKGNSAPNSIGAGYNSTCGTVTIGGTVYWDGSAYQNGGANYLPTNPLVYPQP